MVRNLIFTVEDIIKGFKLIRKRRYSLMIRKDGKVSQVMERVYWEEIEPVLEKICKNTKTILDKTVDEDKLDIVVEVITLDKKTEEATLNNVWITLRSANN